MITETITYEGYDDERVTESLTFHISRTELLENMDLEARFTEIQKRFENNPDAADDPELRQEIVLLLKFLIDLSYGERSEDRKNFRKSADILDRFKTSAAYDEFFFSLFEEPEKAVRFMTGILPEKLRTAAKAEMAANEALSATSLASTVDHSEIDAEIQRLQSLKNNE